MQGRIYSVSGIPCLYCYDYRSGKKRYFVKTQYRYRVMTQNLDVPSGISQKRLRREAAKAVQKLKNQSPSSKKMSDWIEEYIAVHQLSLKTAKAYRRILRDYAFDGEKNAQKLAETLRLEKNVTQITRTVRAFFSWLSKNGIDIPNPAANVKLPKYEPRSRTLTPHEVKTFYRKLEDAEPELRLFGRLLLETGARVSSIYQLKTTDLSPEGLQLCNLKCRRPYRHPIPLSEATQKLWRDYLESKPHANALFLSNFYVLNAHLRRILDENFNQDAHRERIVIHSLRHTAATMAFQNGVPLDMVGRMLDHASLNTTYRIYAKSSQAQLQEAFEKLHRSLSDDDEDFSDDAPK